jgi:type IV secretory pathway VirB4 component
MKILNARNMDAYADTIATLPPMVQTFFETEFTDEQFTRTKKEVGWRLWSMLKNPTFARIFSAPTNPIDMYDQMASKRLILIDSDVNLLSERGSSLFGRLFIAQVLQAARRRFKGTHRRVYLYIDEAPIYFDHNLATMLEQARKANIGVILAHQDLDQARSRNLLSSILGNTATKFAGGLSDADARIMAANMQTSAEFIKGQKKRSFAAYIGGETYSVTADMDQVDLFNTRDVAVLKEEMERLYGYEPAKAELYIPPPDGDPPVEPPPNPPVEPRKADSAPDQW